MERVFDGGDERHGALAAHVVVVVRVQTPHQHPAQTKITRVLRLKHTRKPRKYGYYYEIFLEINGFLFLPII